MKRALFIFLCSKIQFAACATFACNRLECLLFLCGSLALSPGEGSIVFTEHFDSQKGSG